MTIKKKTRAAQDENWFMFASGLSLHLMSDYISLKYCFHFEKLAFAPSNVVKIIEVIEKSLKMYLAFQEQPIEPLKYFTSGYGHNLEKLRAKASTYDVFFDDREISEFTKSFDDKSGNLYQKLRYGSHPKIEGFSTNLNLLMPIADKIFFNCVFLLEENWRKLIISSSIIHNLLVNSNYSQAQNPTILMQALRINNPYLDKFEKYSSEIHKQNQLMMKQIREAEAYK